MFYAFVKSSPFVRPAVTLPCCKTQDARRTFEMHVPHALRLPARDRFHVGRRQRESIARERLSNNGINNSSPRCTSKSHVPLLYISLQLDAMRQLIKKNNPSRKLSAAIPHTRPNERLRYSPAHAAACLRYFVGVKFLSCISLIYMCQSVAPALQINGLVHVV